MDFNSDENAVESLDPLPEDSESSNQSGFFNDLADRMNTHELEKGSVEIPDYGSTAFSWRKLWVRFCESMN